MKPANIALTMLAFGIFGALGSRIGGTGVDKWGSSRMLLYGLAAHIIPLALLPLFNFTLAGGLAVITLWIFAMFMIAPAVQTYFIQAAPESSSLVLSLNTSIIHLGLAAGAGLGGVVVTSLSTVLYNPWVAGGAILLSFIAAIASFSMREKKLQKA
jgi:DHA1 family putative efflux transporter-like MFS transporter